MTKVIDTTRPVPNGVPISTLRPCCPVFTGSRDNWHVRYVWGCGCLLN